MEELRLETKSFPKPILVARFEEIRKKPEIDPSLKDFTGDLGTDTYRRYSFEEAEKAFEFVFDREKFIRCVTDQPSEENFLYLKRVRRFGLILKANYRFANVTHLCDEKFNTFLSLLGVFNDTHWIAPSDKIKSELLNNLENFTFSLDPIDDAGFGEYAKSILSDIDALIKEDTLTAEKFHTLRKRFRLFSNFLQVAAAQHYGKEAHWLFFQILGLSTKLGEDHDELIQKTLNHEATYHESVFEVSPAIREDFKRLKPFLEKVFRLS